MPQSLDCKLNIFVLPQERRKQEQERKKQLDEEKKKQEEDQKKLQNENKKKKERYTILSYLRQYEPASSQTYPVVKIVEKKQSVYF